MGENWSSTERVPGLDQGFARQSGLDSIFNMGVWVISYVVDTQMRE